MADKYSLPPNHPKPIEAEECSWLGRWQDVGWSIRITPKLSPDEWRTLNSHYGEAWNKETFSYNGMQALEMLHKQFPRHELALVWPRCTYRTRIDRANRPPVYTECNAQAQHTEVRVVDVTGARVGIARCDLHKGQL